MNSQNYRLLMQPVLSCIAEAGGEIHFEDVIDQVALAMRARGTGARHLLPSGRDTVLRNDVLWAIKYLQQADQLQWSGSMSDPVTVTQKGYRTLGLVADASPSTASSPVAGPCEGGFAEQSEPFDMAGAEPAQAVEQIVQRHNRDLISTLLNRILEQTPTFFEQLVVDLLLAMGYGCGGAGLAHRLGKTADGGIDGIVTQDVLGLDVIYLQAKRYRPGAAVGSGNLRDFAGALDAHRASRGLFITTSHFTRKAREFVCTTSRNIVLMDGQQLAGHMITYNVGVHCAFSANIKRVDEEYFDPGY